MSVLLINGNALRIPLADESVHCVVTSPVYWGLRDYNVDGQLGLEPTPEEYIANMVAVFREVRRVLRSDGTCWVNLGDSYSTGTMNGHKNIGQRYNELGSGPNGKWAKHRPIPVGLKPKDLVGIPWRVALALQADGWWLRSDIIWHKPNPMPESVTDRPTKSHEYLFLLTKSARYFYDADAVREGATTPFHGGVGWQQGNINNEVRPPTYTDMSKERLGRNRRTVWTTPTSPYSGAHFATYPPALVEPCIKAGTSEAGCCSVCGAPWVRVTEKTTQWRESPNQYTRYRDINGQPDQRKAGTSVVTLGFRPGPDCTHYDEYYHRDYPKARSARKRHQRNISGDWWTRVREQPGLKSWNAISCTVFDPFLGSGTTALVARSLGRNAAGIDLSVDYLLLARKRLSMDRLEAWENGGKKRKQATKPILDLPLFGSIDERIENE